MTRGKIPAKRTGIKTSHLSIRPGQRPRGVGPTAASSRWNFENFIARTRFHAQRQWVYHEERLRTPLKRVGPRGSGEFAPISWTEALDTVAENLQRLKAESGPESVVFYCGYPKQLRPFLQRLALLYGSRTTALSPAPVSRPCRWVAPGHGQMADPIWPTPRLLVWTGTRSGRVRPTRGG
jgi:hypothetical protein